MKIDLRALLIAAAVGAAVLVPCISVAGVLLRPAVPSSPGDIAASDAILGLAELGLLAMLLWCLTAIVYSAVGGLYAFFRSRESQLGIPEAMVGGSLAGLLAGLLDGLINPVISLSFLSSPPVTDPSKILSSVVPAVIVSVFAGVLFGAGGGRIGALWVAKR